MSESTHAGRHAGDGASRPDWTWATLAELGPAMSRGEVTSAALVDGALAQAGEVEGWLRSFAWLDPQRAKRLAAEADAEARRRLAAGEALGPLHGIPIGVKDIVDTAGVPTEHGSPLFAGRVPERSAAAVLALEGAGAVVVGKTVTAEMAYFHPGPTLNPWRRDRTPGGSSMGSAAAVAAGIVPGAVGTQTNGSVIRPAAFCGVVGFEPSAGRLSREGMLQFSATLDQPGGFTRSVADAALLAAALAGEDVEEWWDAECRDAAGRAAPGRGPRLAVAQTADWPHAAPAQQARFREDVAALRGAGAVIEDAPLPDGLEACPATHRTIMAYEGAQSLGAIVARSPERVSETLHRFLAEGAAIPKGRYREAQAERERLVARFRAWAKGYDAVLTPPATGEAPGPETTGDPRFCTRWTLVGAPTIVLPTGRGPAGLPLGLQLVGAQGDDRRLLGAAAWAERVLSGLLPGLPGIGRPPL